jgi:multidrug efflux pump subunit AcrA (membrane-fusion protein)
MPDRKAVDPEADSSETVQVFPVESPSENFSVAEHLQRMPSLFSRGLLYLTILIVLAALVYILVSKIDIVVESRSVVQPSTHKIRVLSDRDGYLEKIFIAEGQRVEKEAALFLIRSKEALTHRTKVDELTGSIPLKREFYDTKISSIRDELTKLENEYERILSVKRLKLEQNDLSLRSLDSDLRYWRGEENALSKEFDDVKRLFEKRLISIAYYNNVRGRLEKARSEIEKLLSQKNITLKENRIVEEEIEEAKSSAVNKRRIFEKEIRNLELEKSTTLRAMQSEMEMSEKMLSIKSGLAVPRGDKNEKGNLVQAEKAGTVSELYFRNTGEFVRASDLLCTILPADSPYYMDITVANKDIGFIENGTEITYKFDAFPYSDYGTLSGKVMLISPSAVEDKAQGFIYRLQGSLDQTYFEIKGKKYPVKPGMTATAELVTEKKSIFSILFKKVKGET